MPVGLLGVELLVGSVGYPGLAQVLTKQGRPDHDSDHPGGDAARDKHQGLGEQTAAAASPGRDRPLRSATARCHLVTCRFPSGIPRRGR